MPLSVDRVPSGPAWVLVADAGRADIYVRHTRRGPLEALQSLTEADAGTHEHELVTDKPGRTFDSAGYGRHAKEPDHTVRQHLRTAFAQRIAHVLEAGRTANQFGRLIIVAGPTMLGELRSALDETTAKRVVAEFDKEMTAQTTEAIARLIDASW